MSAETSPAPPAEGAGKKGGRFRLLRAVLSWALGLGLLGYVVYACVSDREAMQSLKRFPLGLLAALVVAEALYNFASSQRFFVVARHLGLKDLSTLAWFRIFVVSKAMNMILGQLGNVYRAVSLKRIYGFSYSKVGGTYFTFSLLDALLNCLLMAVAVAIWNPSLRLAGLPVLPVAAAMAGAVALSLPLMAVIGRAVARRTLGSDGFAARTARKASEILTSVTDLRLMATVCGIGFLAFLLNMATVYFAFAGMGHWLDMASLVIFVAILRFSYVVIVTPGNLGIRELAYGFLSTAMGMEMSQGLVVSALLRFSTYAVLGILTGAFMIAGREKDPVAAGGNGKPAEPAGPA